MEKYIDPTYDAGFKLVFGREEVSNELLCEFLNSLFEGDPELSDIKSVSYRNTEMPGEFLGGRGIRYDILCETGSGHRFIVEMQKSWQAHFVKRAEYYHSRAIVEQGYRGKETDDSYWDFNYVPVIGVYICQSHIRGIPEKLVTKARLMDEDTRQPIGSSIRYVYIQLPCFSKSEKECDSYFEEWIYNLKNMGPNQYVAFTGRRDVFDRLAQVSNVANLSAEERRGYEADLKFARDYVNVMETAKSESYEKGSIDRVRKIVLSMRANGLDNVTIAKLTGEPLDLVASV